MQTASHGLWEMTKEPTFSFSLLVHSVIVFEYCFLFLPARTYVEEGLTFTDRPHCSGGQMASWSPST